MKVVPDYIEIPLKAKDPNWEVDFNVAFKILKPELYRQLAKKLSEVEDQNKIPILLSNIVYVDRVADAKGNLTNSFETDILKSVLSSLPYFRAILANFQEIPKWLSPAYIERKKEDNLILCGKYQYELDYGKQDLETKIKEDTEYLQENLGMFMNFDDEPPKEEETLKPKREELSSTTLPNLVWESNLPYLRLFNIANRYTNEWGILNPIVIIELAKEFELRLEDTLKAIPLIKAGYESMKPETT
jgi:hypothetical protein